MRIIRYFFEFVLIVILFTIFKVIGLKLASVFGGLIAKNLAPFLKKDKIIKKNISYVLPNISEKEMNLLIIKMWENIGRIFGEYVHLDKFSIYNKKKIRIKFITKTDLDKLQHFKKPIVFFSGHFANFELMGKCLKELNFNLGVIYRPLNNIFVNPIWEFLKKSSSSILIEKGHRGSRKLINHITKNNALGLLVDQRLSSSIHVPFFNKLATTTTTPAKLALKHNALLVPMFIKRLNKVEFEFLIDKPLVIEKTNNYEKDIFNITHNMNKKIEEFILNDPTQWTWIHDRWR